MHRGGYRGGYRGVYRGRGRGAALRGKSAAGRGSHVLLAKHGGRAPVSSRLGIHPSQILDARDRLVMSKRNVHDARAFIRKSQFDKSGDLRAVLTTQESDADADIVRELKRVGAERGTIRDASDNMLLSQGSRNQHPMSKRGGGMFKGKTLVISRQFNDAPPPSSPPPDESLHRPNSRSRSPIYMRRSLSRSPPRPPPPGRRRAPPDDLPPSRDARYRQGPLRDDVYHDPVFSRELGYGDSHSRHDHPNFRGRAGPRDYSPPHRDYRLDYREPFPDRSRSPPRQDLYAHRRDPLMPPEHRTRPVGNPRRSSYSHYDELQHKDPRYDHPRDYSLPDRRGPPPRPYSPPLRRDAPRDEIFNPRPAHRNESFPPRREVPFHSRFSHSPSPTENQHQIKSQIHVSPGYSRSISNRGSFSQPDVPPGRRRSSRDSPPRPRDSRRISRSPSPDRNRVTSTVHRAGFHNDGEKFPTHPAPTVSSQAVNMGAHPLYKIRVGNLDGNVNQDDIHELFSDLGKVKFAKMVASGTAEVVYCNYDDVTKAIEAYHRRELDGRPMSVEFIGHI